MVSIEEIQAAYYMVAATGVMLAAVFYLLNLRETRRTRRIDTANNLMQMLTCKEGARAWLELLNMAWSDYDDFEKKYGTDYNLDNAVLRTHIWFTYDTIGHQVKKGLADLDTVYDSTGIFALWMWRKFQPVIDEHRRRYVGSDMYRGWEYLAGEILKLKLERDPSYKVPETFIKYIPNKL